MTVSCRDRCGEYAFVQAGEVDDVDFLLRRGRRSREAQILPSVSTEREGSLGRVDSGSMTMLEAIDALLGIDKGEIVNGRNVLAAKGNPAHLSRDHRGRVAVLFCLQLLLATADVRIIHNRSDVVVIFSGRMQKRPLWSTADSCLCHRANSTMLDLMTGSDRLRT